MSFADFTDAEKAFAVQMVLAQRQRGLCETPNEQHARILKRKSEHEQEFRTNNAAVAKVLELASQRDAYCNTCNITNDEIIAHGEDESIREVLTERMNLQNSVEMCKSRADNALREYEKAREAQAKFERGPAQRINKARALVMMKANRQLFPDPVPPPHFVATSSTVARSLCGCQISFNASQRARWVYTDGHGQWIPERCHQSLCRLHSEIAPQDAEQLCRLFRAEMQAAGVPIVEHDEHGNTQK